MEGVRTVWKAKQEFQYILDKTYSALQGVQKSLNEQYQYFDNLNRVYKDKGKPNKKVEACLTDMVCAVSVINELSMW